MKVFVCLALSVGALAAQTFPGSQAIDAAVNKAIAESRLPGAVVVVGHEGRIVHRKAYGKRAVYPRSEDMTVDTIFDIASLTKVVATTPSLMKLFEQGKFRLNDPITQYIPEFQGGKSDITIRNLFTHFSGLAPDVPLDPPWTGYETGIRLACATPPEAPPGVRMIYSDINFELLGELVRRLSGQALNDYAQRNIFTPLDMKDTRFLPPPEWGSRIAPTERNPARTGPPLRGVVDDPTARYMGGVAGHAGVFSTADDLARFAQMMLNGGELDGVRLVSPMTIQKFTEPQTPPDQPVLRGLGWDIDSPYSGNRGELFPIGSYGHTGYTGTSIWIDPATETYVIILANSVHPEARPALTPLRSEVATIAAAAVGLSARGLSLTGYSEVLPSGARREVARNASTKTGLDVLEDRRFDVFQGKRIGLVTNQTGVDREGRRNVDVMKQAGVNVVALFSPEHGLGGAAEAGAATADITDAATGIKVYSLYGETRRPTPEMLRGLDALAFDIQDAGARFYTYETTMAYCMEAAAKAHLPFYVLDRPNPITGSRVEGPLLDAGDTSFVGYLSGMPARHGMTMGELAKLFDAENKIGAALTVIPMQDWRRGDWFDATDLPWVNPSPNIRSLNAALLYPGLCLLEAVPGLSMGRGTDAPFEQVGAGFLDGRALADYLNSRLIPGVRAYPTSFTPADSVGKGTLLQGVRFAVVNREIFDAARLGMELASALLKLYPGKVDLGPTKTLLGSNDAIQRLTAGQDPRAILDSYRDAVAAFVAMRRKYLLYQ
ncbi:MAG TPA: exo-beta-N-acetylmuramidase NamZ domain-containing protein [Bryobacteraceae bacterium]|nr:exo-beta-N-acetylmuramidase NamZ domain-containing protein [Bryobacteraceae bacterium]